MRFIKAFLLLLLCSASVFAQQDKSLLWKISGKGLKAPSYLFGTIHLICKDDIKVSEAMKESMKQSGKLFLELDMDEPGIQMKMLSKATMKDGKRLKDLISEEEYKMLSQFFKDSMQIPLEMMGGLKPLMLSSVTASKMLNCASQGSWETTLVELAKEGNKPVEGLETVEQQLAVFDKIPYEDQAKMLVESVKDFQKTKKDFAELLKLYREQDVEGLYNLSQNQSEKMSKSEGPLLTDRNKNWIPLIKKAASEQSCFFAVGAAHLGGKKGVIALLKKAGYTVEPIATN